MNDLTLIADKWRLKICLATLKEKMNQLFPAKTKLNSAKQWLTLENTRVKFK